MSGVEPLMGSSRPHRHRSDPRRLVDPVARSGDLLRRAQTGDHAAFTGLIRGCDERMRRLAHRMIGDAGADDALQDAYVKAYRNLSTFDGRSAFSTWLYTIVYRTCLDQIRTRNRRAEVDLSAIGEQPSTGMDHPTRHAESDALTRALPTPPTRPDRGHRAGRGRRLQLRRSRHDPRRGRRHHLQPSHTGSPRTARQPAAHTNEGRSQT